MSYLTYRELIEGAKNWSEEQLDQTVTILDLDCDEYFPCNGTSIARQDDSVLDENHIILVINAEIGAYGK